MATTDLPVAGFSDSDRSALREFFFRENYRMESPIEVVRWWEKRRLMFNAVVGGAGLTSVTAIYAAAMLGPDGRMGGPPLVGIIAYGVIANLAYTSGWIAELFLRPVFKERTPVVGSALLRYGFAFSVGLTLLPVPVAAVSLILRVLSEMLN